MVTAKAPTFKNLVVALDGSKEAEAILPYVEPLAGAFNAHVTFVCALVPVQDTAAGEMALTNAALYPDMIGDLYETQDEVRKQDDTYLDTLTKSWAARGFDVGCVEPRMLAAEAIVQVAREQDADLIALATHARTGLDRVVQRSVADEVVHTAPCPVLLVRSMPERRGANADARSR